MLTQNPVSNLTPERQVAKLLGVSDTIVYDWKRKVKTPSPKNTAKILIEVMKRRPKDDDPCLTALEDILIDKVLKTYILLLEKNISRDIQNISVRNSVLDCIPALTYLIFCTSEAYQPAPFPYTKLGLNEEFKLKLINEHQFLLSQSIAEIKSIVDKAQVIYENY